MSYVRPSVIVQEIPLESREIHYSKLIYENTPCVIALHYGRVCYFSFGVGEDSLEIEIREAFKEYELIEVSIDQLRTHGAPMTRLMLRDIADGISWAWLTVPRTSLTLGTDFQKRVWRAIEEIPYGETRTYKQIAEEIGYPRASRAVARACATNKIAMFVPCHRVISSTGAISGYKWGVHLKEHLLKEEKEYASTRRSSSPSGTA